MNFKWAMIGFGLLVFSLSVLASCADPLISISSSSDRFSIGGKIDINLVYSADPSPSTLCQCLQGGDCGMQWQTDYNGEWNMIPQTTEPTIDLNCSGVSCRTDRGFPSEDLMYSRTVSCVDQNSFHVRGYHPFTDTSSPILTVHCYPSPACTPPASGNFNVNQACTFIAVPVLVDGNYNIGSSGYVKHNDSDVNFFSSGPKYVNIQNGGRIDLNQSMIFAGLSFEQGLLGGLFGLIGLGLAGFYSLFVRRKGAWA